MTEFETATPAVQRMGMLVAAVVGFSKCALIGGGLVVVPRFDQERKGARRTHPERAGEPRNSQEEPRWIPEELMKNHHVPISVWESSHAL